MSEDAIQKLVKDVKDALADGKISVIEILRIVKDLLAIIGSFMQGKTIS